MPPSSAATRSSSAPTASRSRATSAVVRPPQQKLQRIAHAPRDLTRLLGPRQGLVVDPQQLGGLHLALLPNQVPQELAQPEPP